MTSLADERQARKLQARGDKWQFQPQLEAAVKLKKNDPDAYEKLDPSTRMSVALYEADKDAANVCPTCGGSGRDATRETSDDGYADALRAVNRSAVFQDHFRKGNP